MTSRLSIRLWIANIKLALLFLLKVVFLSTHLSNNMLWVLVVETILAFVPHVSTCSTFWYYLRKAHWTWEKRELSATGCACPPRPVAHPRKAKEKGDGGRKWGLTFSPFLVQRKWPLCSEDSWGRNFCVWKGCWGWGGGITKYLWDVQSTENLIKETRVKHHIS